MNDMSPLAHAGHNNPPSGPFMPEELATKFNDFLDAGGSWLDLKEIKTEEHSAKLTDFMTGGRYVAKLIEEERVKQKKPHDDAGKAVQEFFKAFDAKITKTLTSVKAMQTAYLQEKARQDELARQERQRAAAEAEAEARRKAAEAEARNDISGQIEAEQAQKAAAKESKAAAAPVKTTAQSATGAGRSMALRKTYYCKVEALGPALSTYRDHPKVLELLEQLATAEVRGQGPDKAAPKGFTLHFKETAA